MSAAAARIRPGAPLRPEQDWEPIFYPGGGLYVARRIPTVELIVDEYPSVIVLFTHDYAVAAQAAWPLWFDEQGGRLTRPRRHWWRRVPADPATALRCGYDHMWWPARPGTPGATPLVEFPFPTPPASPANSPAQGNRRAAR